MGPTFILLLFPHLNDENDHYIRVATLVIESLMGGIVACVYCFGTDEVRSELKRVWDRRKSNITINGYYTRQSSLRWRNSSSRKRHPSETQQPIHTLPSSTTLPQNDIEAVTCNVTSKEDFTLVQNDEKEFTRKETFSTYISSTV